MTDTKISALPSGGAIQATDLIPVARNVSGTLTSESVSVGTAAAKTASDVTKTSVASVSGTIAAGHLAVFGDTAGSIIDGGAVPSGNSGITALTGDATASGSGSVAITVTKINGQTPAAVATSGAYADLNGKPTIPTVGTAGSKSASDNTKSSVASVSGVTVVGHVATFGDTAGTVQDGGLLGTAAALTAGAANGVATLDSGGKIPAAQIPATAVGALTYGATIAWDASTIKIANVTLTGNATLALPTNLTPGRYALTIKQDATGGRTLAYATGWLFPGGLKPTLSTGANAVDLLDVIYDGTNLIAAMQYGVA